MVFRNPTHDEVISTLSQNIALRQQHTLESEVYALLAIRCPIIGFRPKLWATSPETRVKYVSCAFF